jgi:hypothetical protein
VRLIQPAALTRGERRRPLLTAAAITLSGVALAIAAVVSGGPTLVVGTMAAAASVAIGVGAANLRRAIDPRGARPRARRLADLLAPAFDDDYTLVVAPHLPVRDAGRLDGILIGPAGMRVITVRDWEGRYRVRGRVWEFDARGRHGWIRCRTNPSHDGVALAEGVARWAQRSGLGELPLRAAIAFPSPRSRVILEEPGDEIVTGENVPWWANSIGRARRLDPAAAARVLAAILDASEMSAGTSARAVSRDPG